MATNPAKILLFDIESTNLKSDFGTVLCIGYKWYGQKKIHCPAITDYKGWEKDPTDCSKLLEDFYKVYEEADAIVTYNGKRFDVPFLQGKFFEYQMPFLPPVAHIDLYYAAKHNLGITRKSLQNVSYVGKFKSSKTPVEGRIWRRASVGHTPSLLYIKRHCIADIELLEECYDRLKPVIRTHPRVNGYGPCRTCGADQLQRRGRALTIQKSDSYRFQCQACGCWETRRV